MFKAYFLHSK